MEKELIIRNLKAEIFKLQNKNRMLKRHLHILISAPASISADRIRFVKGSSWKNSSINLN